MDEVHIKDIVEMWINDVLGDLLGQLDIVLNETSNRGQAPFGYMLGIYPKGEAGTDKGRMIAGKLFEPEIVLFTPEDEYSVDEFTIEDPKAGEKLRAHVERYLQQWVNNG
jgi:hypothetical protein